MNERTGNNFLPQEVARVVKRSRLYSEGVALTPKRARVIDVDPKFSPPFPPRQSTFVLEGEGFDDSHLRRTVFLEKPVLIDHVPYYLEVKGYGRSGKELYAAKHDEGDLSFGTYIDTASKEFYFPRLLAARGITNIQHPVALFLFEEADFVEYAMQGLRLRLAGRLQFDPQVRSGIEQLLRVKIDRQGASGESDDAYYALLAKAASGKILDEYKIDGKNGLVNLAQEAGLVPELSGIIDHRDAGYMIRAVKSPIRVGSQSDPAVFTDTNRNIARQMGQTVRQMLGFGFFHTSPHPGNWTTQGELVNFANVFKYPRDRHDIEPVMAFFKAADMDGLIRFAFGKPTLGFFEEDFHTGFMGKPTDIEEITHKTLEILDSHQNADT